ncbi:MAG TPA: NFACT RNA binding domain-containing protein [Cyclobacteriaceae bacterium]|nr:NFACT RNA binding domain-containing protein [Cyclobacteriaceae bacterium]
MHNNYYFLKQLTPHLESVIKGAIVSECFSQNKNELIIRLEIQKGSFFIKGSFQPGFSCLSFPEEFNRARKNSVDLFGPIIGQSVISLTQFENERCFSIQLSEEWLLLFKMYGNKSNIILFRNDTVQDLFRKKLAGDEAMNLSALNRRIDWTFETFVKNQDNLEKLCFTFGKVVWRYLYEKGFHESPLEKKWDLIQRLLTQLNDKKYFISEFNDSLFFSLIEFGNVRQTFLNPIDAINYFFPAYSMQDAFTTEKGRTISALSSRLSGSLNYLRKIKEKLAQIRSDDHYKTWADLIMANLNIISPGQSSVELANFYENNLITEVKLKKDLSPQKNAELYYKKAKNHALEIEHLVRTIHEKEKGIKDLQVKIDTVKAADNLRTLRAMTKTLVNLDERSENTPSLPYHEFAYSGFRIWVGKSAAANDELTLKYAFKDDLWLHAKDVAGSHVIIKHQAGKNFPKDVIERAAQLAAHNSKRKNETLCPVIVTPKKYVRKRKGDPPGAVVVEREEVIMVEPKK